MQRLNIGAGKDLRPGYRNADLYPSDPKIVERANLLNLHYADDTFDEILALDIVEHISWRDVPKALAQIARVLKPGGTAEIRVPDLDELLSLRQAGRINEREYVRRIFGDQGHPGDFHNAGFTKSIFDEELRKAGLKIEETWALNGNRSVRVSLL